MSVSCKNNGVGRNRRWIALFVWLAAMNGVSAVMHGKPIRTGGGPTATSGSVAAPMERLVESGSKAATDEWDRIVVPFVDQHCAGCHGDAANETGFHLDLAQRDLGQLDAAESWSKVAEMLRSDTMPPVEVESRPDSEQALAVLWWLTEQIERGARERSAQRAAVQFDRLSRQEIVNSIDDLLGVRINVDDLPEDPAWRGWTRLGSHLPFSPSHLEVFLDAAEEALDEAFPDDPPSPRQQSFDARQLLMTQIGTPDATSESPLDGLRIDLWPGQVLRLQPDPPVQPDQPWAPGMYSFRIRLSGVQPIGARPPHLAVYAGQPPRLLYECDFVADESAPREIQFTARLSADDQELTVKHELPGPRLLTKFRRSWRKQFISFEEGYVPWQYPLIDEQREPLLPCLIIDQLQWQGPIVDSDLQLQRDRYLVADVEQQEVEIAQIEWQAGLKRFAQDALRRPITSAEFDRYVDLVEQQQALGDSQRQAIKTAMLSVLGNAEFLYLMTGHDPNSIDGASIAPRGPDADEKLPLSDWQLAARLSYFLWSSLPDQGLRQLAGEGQLQDPDVLEREVLRMLADPRAARFVDDFTRQWLQLDRVGQFQPDKLLYPDYDAYLERSMIEECRRFFGTVLDDNLSVSEFLESDWSILNARLAQHYLLPTDGLTHEFERVSLPADHPRGGVLTQAAILTLTSDGTRHRPVHRGVWISESILGKTPPPPPDNVDEIESNPLDQAKTSVRDKLSTHAQRPSCAACHRHIDPWGVAFDAFDAIGRWRSEEHVPTGVGADPSVNSSGVLADGRTFADATQLKELLLDDIDSFHFAFVEKLAGYAVRRPLTLDQQSELQDIVAQSRDTEYRLVDLIRIVVLSDLFRRR